MQTLTSDQKICMEGVPWWLSRLRIWHCHCCGLGSIPGPGTSACWGNSQKKKKKKKKREWKFKGLRRAKTNRKKSKVGGLTIPDLRTYSKATVIKKVLHCCKDRQIYSRNWHNTVNQLYFNNNNNKKKDMSCRCGAEEMNPTSIHEHAGSIPGLA